MVRFRVEVFKEKANAATARSYLEMFQVFGLSNKSFDPTGPVLGSCDAITSAGKALILKREVFGKLVDCLLQTGEECEHHIFALSEVWSDLFKVGDDEDLAEGVGVRSARW